MGALDAYVAASPGCVAGALNEPTMKTNGALVFFRSLTAGPQEPSDWSVVCEAPGLPLDLLMRHAMRWGDVSRASGRIE